MAENDFSKVLQNSVNEDVLAQTKLKELERELMELQSQVIKTPDQEKRMNEIAKEMATIIKEAEQSKKKEAKKDEIKKEEKSVEGKSVEEIKQEGEEKAKKKQDGIEPNIEDDASTEKAYEDAMQQLHDFRIKMYNNQMKDKNNIKLNSSREEFKQELELEKKKVALKAKYEAELGDKENALKEKEERLAREERQAREPIQREIRERSRKYAEAMVALHKVNLELAYIHELKQKDKISEVDYETRRDIALNKQKELKDEIAKLKPDELMKAMEEEKLRKGERAKVLGKDFEAEAYKNASFEEKKNLDYEKSKKITQQRNLEFAEREKVLNTKARVEERENHIKQLKKELDDLPEDDIERRLEILKELEVENLQLEHDNEQMDRIERGEVLDTNDEIKENAKIKEEIEYVEEENKKDYAKTQAAIDAIEKAEGEVAVKKPETDFEKEEKRKAVIVTGAVVGAAVLGDEHDTPAEDLGQAAVGAFVAKNCVIPGLEEKVNDPNTVEGANAILEEDAKIKAAKEELAKNQRAVEKEVGNI